MSQNSKRRFVKLFIFTKHTPYPTTAGSARNNTKKRQEEMNKGRRRMKKKFMGQKAKPSTPCANRGRRTNRKQKKEQKKKQGAGPQLSYLDHSVSSYDPHGSYSWAILKRHSHREKDNN